MALKSKKTAATKRGLVGRAKRVLRPKASRRVVVLVSTRKGAWLYHSDGKRKSWRPRS